MSNAEHQSSPEMPVLNHPLIVAIAGAVIGALLTVLLTPYVDRWWRSREVVSETENKYEYLVAEMAAELTLGAQEDFQKQAKEFRMRAQTKDLPDFLDMDQSSKEPDLRSLNDVTAVTISDYFSHCLEPWQPPNKSAKLQLQNDCEYERDHYVFAAVSHLNSSLAQRKRSLR